MKKKKSISLRQDLNLTSQATYQQMPNGVPVINIRSYNLSSNDSCNLSSIHLYKHYPLSVRLNHD